MLLMSESSSPDYLGGLLKILQSPQVRGMAESLLAASQPSMTTPTQTIGGAMAGGLAKGAQYADIERQRKLQEREQTEKERHNKQSEELNKLKQELEEQKAEAERKRQDVWSGILNPQNIPSAPTSTVVEPTAQGGILAATQKPIIHNPDGSISTEETITVTEPSINGSRPTNIETIINGKRVSDEEAIKHAANRLAGGEQIPSYDTIDLAEQAARSRSNQLGQEWQNQQAQGGMLGQGIPQNVPHGTMPPPPMPTGAPPMPPPQMPRPQNDMIPINLGGAEYMVPRSNYMRAQALFAAGDLEGAAKALTETPDLTDIEKRALRIFGDLNSQEAKDFIKEATLRPSTQVNIGENTEKVQKQELAKADVESIKESASKARPGRELVSRALETKEIAQQMRKKGLDPARFWATRQMDKESIKAALGVQDSQENVSLVERLNKNAIYLMSDMVKGLGGRPNQYVEQQFAKAVPGSSVTLDTIEKLSDALIPVGRENQFEGRFKRDYLTENDSLAGYEDAYEMWLETQPFTKTDDKGRLKLTPEREVSASYKLWVNPEKTYQRLLNKSADTATEAELKFMATYGATQ